MSEPDKCYNPLLEKFLIYITSTISLFVFIPHVLTIIILAVSGIVYLVLQDNFIGIKTSPFVHIRIVFFWLIICLIACFVFHDEWAPYSLIPALVIQYVILNKLNRVLILQEKFLDQISDKEGQELSVYLRDDYLVVEEFNILMGNNKVLLLVLSIINLFGMLAFYFIKGFSFFKALSVIIYFISVSGHLIIYHLYSNETYYAFLGFKNILQKKRTLLKSALMIVGVSLLFGVVFSSNKALISFTPNQEIPFDNYVTPDLPPPVTDYDYKQPEFEHSGDLFEPYTPLINWELIEQIAKIVFSVLLIVLFLYFLIHYIFTNKFFSFFKENVFIELLKDFFSKIRNFFYELFNLSKDNSDPYATVSSKKFKKQMVDFLHNSNKSSKKRNELDRLTREFMKIIEWGYKKGIKYKNTMAPFEYSIILANQFDIIKEQADICGRLFEKALYSDSLLTKMEETDFCNAVHTIIRNK